VDYVRDRIRGSMRDWVGQLEESGEYQMGRLRVFYFHVQSSEGGSPLKVHFGPLVGFGA
jgi:hypothetical protein